LYSYAFCDHRDLLSFPTRRSSDLFGIYSEIIPTFARKRLFGHQSMVWATAGIAFLSFLVWVHHFFTMGNGALINKLRNAIPAVADRKSTRLNSSHVSISYAVFCLK